MVVCRAMLVLQEAHSGFHGAGRPLVRVGNQGDRFLMDGTKERGIRAVEESGVGGMSTVRDTQDKDYTIPLLERWVHRTKLQDAGPVPGDEAGVGRAYAPHLDELPGYATS